MGSRVPHDRHDTCLEVHRVRSRTKGMWWGTAIEAPDPAALARFYPELLGWTKGYGPVARMT
jgi:hypothetical protein